MVSSKSLDDLKRLAKTFEGILELGRALEEIASIDQASKESIDRLAGLKAQEQAAIDSADNAKALESTIKERVALVINSANQSANETVERAKCEAQSLIDSAQAKAKESVDSAKAELTGIEAEHEAIKVKVAVRRAELDSLNSEINRLKNEFQNLTKSFGGIK